MSAIGSNIGRPAGAKAPVRFAQFLSDRWEALVGHFVRRAAIATLREFDYRALRDIGLARTQIEAAVHGLVRSEQERMP